MRRQQQEQASEQQRKQQERRKHRPHLSTDSLQHALPVKTDFTSVPSSVDQSKNELSLDLTGLVGSETERWTKQDIADWESAFLDTRRITGSRRAAELSGRRLASEIQDLTVHGKQGITYRSQGPPSQSNLGNI